MHGLRNALAMMVLLLMALACGVDGDERMVRRHAECMVDSNTTLHRLTLSEAIGTVALSAETVEERLRGQLKREEITMDEIRDDFARYCE
ncbi:MAG: hypothetical protein OXE87_16875 [Chloroflexi bacterium]|nr:hypothetical protein [Chloroflexota bacterium]